MNFSPKQRKSIFVLFIVVIFALSGCGSNDRSSSAKEKKATLAFSWSPTSLDPHSSDSWEVMRSGVAETLVKLDNDLEPTPWLAKSWKQKNDTTWVFELHNKVIFHNGKKMTAEEVKNSLQRAIDQYDSTKNLLRIKSMKAISSYELEIVTTEPNAALIAHLADPGTIILDVDSIKNGSNPAFTGPFEVEKFNKDEALIVKRFENYWSDKAKLAQVTIKFISDGNTRLMALQSGDVDGATDISTDNIAVLEKNKNFEILTAKSLRTHLLMYNMNSSLFNVLAVREAVDALIPREDIVTSIMKGEGTVATGPFSPALPFATATKVKDATSVDQLMKSAGWKKNSKDIWEKDGKPFEATLLTFPQRPELTVMAEIIQSKLADVGMKVKIRSVENIDTALAEDQWDIAMYSMLTAHTGDPQFFLESFYKSNSPINLNSYNSQTLDKMIDQLSKTTDAKQRNQLAINLQQEIAKDVPHSYLVFPNTIFAAKKSLKGFEALPVEYYYNNEKVTIED